MIQLYLFAEEKMKIDKEKLDQLLKPIEGKSKKVQKNIENYLVKQPNGEIGSERIKRAIGKLKRKTKENEKNKKKKK